MHRGSLGFVVVVFVLVDLNSLLVVVLIVVLVEQVLVVVGIMLVDYQNFVVLVVVLVKNFVDLKMLKVVLNLWQS